MDSPNNKMASSVVFLRKLISMSTKTKFERKRKPKTVRLGGSKQKSENHIPTYTKCVREWKRQDEIREEKRKEEDEAWKRLVDREIKRTRQERQLSTPMEVDPQNEVEVSKEKAENPLKTVHEEVIDSVEMEEEKKEENEEVEIAVVDVDERQKEEPPNDDQKVIRVESSDDDVSDEELIRESSSDSSSEHNVLITEQQPTLKPAATKSELQQHEDTSDASECSGGSSSEMVMEAPTASELFGSVELLSDSLPAIESGTTCVLCDSPIISLPSHLRSFHWITDDEVKHLAKLSRDNHRDRRRNPVTTPVQLKKILEYIIDNCSPKSSREIVFWCYSLLETMSLFAAAETDLEEMQPQLNDILNHLDVLDSAAEGYYQSLRKMERHRRLIRRCFSRRMFEPLPPLRELLTGRKRLRQLETANDSTTKDKEEKTE